MAFMMRLDLYLVERGLVSSRTRAKRLIEEGSVLLNGKVVCTPSAPVEESAAPSLEITKVQKYVSRGGLKLEGALASFGIDVSGLCAIDVGASTGGFTDCLLKYGAAKVYAVDSGEGQLVSSLRNDPRVVNLEKYNARELSAEDFESKIDIAVMDVSFISQTLILPRLAALLPSGGILVSLIKPQFEAGRHAVGKNGIVKKKADRLAALVRVLETASEYGLSCFGVEVSPIYGGDGNVEFISAFCKDGEQKIDTRELVKVAEKQPEKEG